MANFGQRVKLEVFDKSKTTLVFSTEELRVDFDVRTKSGLNTAKITVFNLNTETSANLVNGERYVRISTALHDQEYQVLVGDMFISNAYVEKILPNSLTYLYCYDVVTRENLENPVSTITKNKLNLKSLVSSIATQAGYDGKVVFALFPEEVLNYEPPRKYGVVTEKTFKGAMNKLAKSFGFEYSIAGNSIICTYLPDFESLNNSLLRSDELVTIVLNSNNLRSNPKIGPANLQVESNLDTNLRPATVLDISKLITASADVSQDNLELASDLIRNVVSGFKRYICLESRHIGSNYTNAWRTTATAVAPRKGTKMNTANWGVV
jgi:hypothetical protein